MQYSKRKLRFSVFIFPFRSISIVWIQNIGASSPGKRARLVFNRFLKIIELKLGVHGNDWLFDGKLPQKDKIMWDVMVPYDMNFVLLILLFKEKTPVRMDLTHSCWRYKLFGGFFFLKMRQRHFLFGHGSPRRCTCN